MGVVNTNEPPNPGEDETEKELNNVNKSQFFYHTNQNDVYELASGIVIITIYEGEKENQSKYKEVKYGNDSE